MPRTFVLSLLIALILVAPPAPACAPAYAASSGSGGAAPELAGVFAASGGGELTQADRDAAVKYLRETQRKFLDSIAQLTEAQWTYKASPDRWSIAEVAEHIALSETFILDMISNKIAKGPAAAKAADAPADSQVIAVIVDRSQTRGSGLGARGSGLGARGSGTATQNVR